MDLKRGLRTLGSSVGPANRPPDQLENYKLYEPLHSANHPPNPPIKPTAAYSPSPNRLTFAARP